MVSHGVSDISPKKVLPGSFVEIQGAGFGDRYGDVVTSVGNREMLVLDVEPNLLLVRIPPIPGALTPLVVNVAGSQIVIDDAFEAAEWPHPSDINAYGPPATFGGVERGV